jgi:hypothetical protein
MPGSDRAGPGAAASTEKKPTAATTLAPLDGNGVVSCTALATLAVLHWELESPGGETRGNSLRKVRDGGALVPFTFPYGGGEGQSRRARQGRWEERWKKKKIHPKMSHIW